MRQIVLDTETTGLEPAKGHRIIEIGAVELIDRQLTHNHFHYYLQPDREIDEGALQVHGITQEFLADKPRFNDIAQAFLDFVSGAELIIHNAPFDIGFLNNELRLLGTKWGRLEDYCQFIDTLVLARQFHPGQKNNLDALCKRYGVHNLHRQLHGALLDSEILADVYLAMTGGQISLSFSSQLDTPAAEQVVVVEANRRLDSNRPKLKVHYASEDELSQHAKRIAAIDQACGGKSLWKDM